MVHALESTMESTYGEVIVNSGIGSPTPCFSLNTVSVQFTHATRMVCCNWLILCTLCVQEFANLPDWVSSSRANDQVAWINTLVGHVWHAAGAGAGGAGDGVGEGEGGAGEGSGEGTGGDLTHRLLSRLEPAVRVSMASSPIQ
jgi:hypothetical protein